MAPGDHKIKAPTHGTQGPPGKGATSSPDTLLTVARDCHKACRCLQLLLPLTSRPLYCPTFSPTSLINKAQVSLPDTKHCHPQDPLSPKQGVLHVPVTPLHSPTPAPTTLCHDHPFQCRPLLLCLVLSLSVMSDLCNPMDYSLPGTSVHGDSLGRNCHFLPQGIFPTQESNSGLPH